MLPLMLCGRPSPFMVTVDMSEKREEGVDELLFLITVDMGEKREKGLDELLFLITVDMGEKERRGWMSYCS